MRHLKLISSDSGVVSESFTPSCIYHNATSGQRIQYKNPRPHEESDLDLAFRNG